MTAARFSAIVCRTVCALVLIGVGAVHAATDVASISTRLRSALEDFVRANAPGDLDAVRIPELGAFDLPNVDPASVDFEFSVNSRENFVGLVPITTLVSVDGIPLKRSVVTARAEKHIAVLVAARSIARGSRIGELDLRVEQRDMSRLSNGTVLDVRSAIGKQASRAIPAGGLLVASMLESIPVIKRGDMVAIRYQSGALRIDSRGISRQDAAVGERVRVLTESRREVSGWISNDGVVHVDF